MWLIISADAFHASPLLPHQHSPVDERVLCLKQCLITQHPSSRAGFTFAYILLFEKDLGLGPRRGQRLITLPVFLAYNINIGYFLLLTDFCTASIRQRPKCLRPVSISSLNIAACDSCQFSSSKEESRSNTSG